MNIIESLKPLAVSIDSIKNDPHNVRSHSERNINVIKKSLETYGQRKPIVVNQDGIIEAGNGMYQAARELGWTEIAAVRVDDVEEVAKAFGIIDNKSAELAEWSLPGLKDVLESLDTGAFDMEATGFDVKEIEDLMTQFHVDEEGLTDDDAIPEDVGTVCKSGDLWKLGNHRLLCGDATKKEDVERLMDGQKADMVFTDPPYGINLDTDYTKVMGRGKKYKKVIGDDNEWDFHNADWFDCNEQFWFGADNYRYTIPKGGSWFVWDKQVSDHDGLSHTGSLFELLWSKASHKQEIIKEPYFRFYGMDTKKRVHPTQKPVKLCVWFLERFSKGTNLIIDLFGGSGSTLIACEKLDRRCYMMEIAPEYNDVIIERWQKFTGKQAEKING